MAYASSIQNNLNQNSDKKCTDFLKLFFSRKITVVTVKETDRYVGQFLCKLSITMPASTWDPVTDGEI
jgi:hypothetical protein